MANDSAEIMVAPFRPIFSPGPYNLPQFKFAHLPASGIKKAWTSWIRWFENVMDATNITESLSRKAQLLAMGGIELQAVYYALPGMDDTLASGADPYQEAKQKLDEHFSPKHHECFERSEFWDMAMDIDETIENFIPRVQQKAETCNFGKTEMESNQIAIIDKIIKHAPEDIRRKLLEKADLTMDQVIRTIVSHQAIKYQVSQMNSKPPSKTEVYQLT
ncbi:uncharacterized protein LOC129760858, partial [Uranotaenia lowii]|uniref:uncharacterized protein LOC129760858 n=1 Tax=Uranotaenia lowii TaxID=190385 RepID=UPI002478EFEE